MIIGIIVFTATLLIAPFMFWLLSHTLYSKLNLKKYPTQVNDGIGDSIFLPLFNGILVELIISLNHEFKLFIFIIAVSISVILTVWFVHYQKNIATYLDWSKPKQGALNLGGWYHATYMLIQIIIVIYGLTIFYNNFFLWIAIIGYLTTTVIQIIKEGHI
jgi:hypothetical protein